VTFDTELRNLYKTHFNQIETAHLHSVHTDYIKRISVFDKDKASEVLGLLQENLVSFNKCIPIIENLKNPSLRVRHWSQLKEQITNMKFLSPADAEFNFELLSRPELIANDVRIRETSSKANHEKQIEDGLEAIKNEWTTVKLSFEEKISKDQILEEVFERHKLLLSTYKISG
jgi:dynein heavy chain